MITAKEREKAFRKAFLELLEEHSLFMEITDSGELGYSGGYGHPILNFYGYLCVDNDLNITLESVDFEW